MTRAKQQAGEHAASLVVSGMVVGLGNGSTAIFATRRIAAMLRAGELRDVTGIATSNAMDGPAAQDESAFSPYPSALRQSACGRRW